MSGYLQRLAASAAWPSRAVHPLVGGIFAKEQRHEPRPEPGVAEPGVPESGVVELLVDRHDEALPASHARPAAETREQPKPGARADARPQVTPLPAEGQKASSSGGTQTQPAQPPIPGPIASIAPRGEFVPLVAGWRQSTTPAQAMEEGAIEKKIAARPERVEGGEASAPAPPSAEQSAGLQPVPSAPGVRIAEVPARQEAAASREAVLKPVAATLPAMGARASEEIQIHIGRIEVIAVPPQAQRAAPARTQRGESLEAYLKRHEGRSR
jgi:hypothetical protein